MLFCTSQKQFYALVKAVFCLEDRKPDRMAGFRDWVSTPLYRNLTPTKNQLLKANNSFLMGAILEEDQAAAG